MTVLTVYFCGTGSNKFDDTNTNFWNGELISKLATHNLGREFADWIIIDGPGSGNLQDDELWVRSGEHYGWTGSAFGSGWNENINHAMHMIKGNFEWKREKLTEKQYELLKKAGVAIDDVEVTGSLLWRHYDYGNRKLSQQDVQKQIIKTFRKNGLLPSQVNMIGWSRGGISCHMLANAMLADPELADIPVNIFAVDPVPGPFNSQKERTSLGKNVKQYVAFYARDERSKGFSCVIPEADASTSMHIFPLPGRHATLVGNASIDGASEGKALVEPGMIVRHFAEVCLTRWGVSLEKTLQLESHQLKVLHEAMQNNADIYKKMQSYSYTVITESSKGERSVSHGAQSAPFSEVKGERFNPVTGLESDYLIANDIYESIQRC